ncbi:dipeptide ABC transporter ATP-binding protein [Pseudochelatococcus lubricantis]|uniref:dipeptide ABC transporter ATP-binding protein n=1 Tax=Pseudochelatococcus lubricantis TaxID=1538102 RepID=UPI0035EB4E11
MTARDPLLHRAANATATPLLTVERLRVGFGRDPAAAGAVVKGISFALEPGRCLAIVGESGSGKSVTARSLVGLTGRNATVQAERLAFSGRDLTRYGERDWQRLRGRDIGFVLQDALVSLDQLRPVGDEVGEGLRIHRVIRSREEQETRVVELLRLVGVPEPEVKARQLPHELSGGQRQRALIASALALDPALLIADEPTTALDVTVQAQILDLLEATRNRGKALILISHDLSVVSRMADEVIVMRHGEVVEQAPVATLFSAPRHEYTRRLLDAIPAAHTRGTRLAPASAPRLTADAAHWRRRGGDTPGPVLEGRDLVKRFRGPDGQWRTVVRGVNFSLAQGETLGIVGESGSGKSTTARLALALDRPDEGTVRLLGRDWSALDEAGRRPLRREISVVYQDPLSSFDPRWTVERIVGDALAGGAAGFGRDAQIDELLELVGLGKAHRRRRPLELSGGQRQRVAIARAMAPRPRIIVCDEPVSALDVSIQAQILDLLGDLKAALGVSYLFISHDLGVIRHLSDRVLVMRNGEVVEEGTADAIFDAPQQDYTRELVSAVLHDRLPRIKGTSHG